jgi:hypothetical protein
MHGLVVVGVVGNDDATERDRPFEHRCVVGVPGADAEHRHDVEAPVHEARDEAEPDVFVEQRRRRRHQTA